MPMAHSTTMKPRGAYTSPYYEFYREQRPLMPAGLSNADREKAVGHRWRALSMAEREVYEQGLTRAPSSGRGGPRFWLRTPPGVPSELLASCTATVAAAVAAAASVCASCSEKTAKTAPPSADPENVHATPAAPPPPLPGQALPWAGAAGRTAPASRSMGKHCQGQVPPWAVPAPPLSAGLPPAGFGRSTAEQEQMHQLNQQQEQMNQLNKRAAPPGPASTAQGAKRASIGPYTEFCKEQRRLLPARASYNGRGELLAWPPASAPCLPPAPTTTAVTVHSEAELDRILQEQLARLRSSWSHESSWHSSR